VLKERVSQRLIARKGAEPSALQLDVVAVLGGDVPLYL